MTLILIFICALAQSSAPTKDKVEAVAPATQSANSDTTRAQKDPVDWRKAEGVLSHQMQLTLSERFVKAGEAYFNSDATQIVFQAIEHDAQGNPESEYYSMYVAQLRDEGKGQSFGPDLRRYRLKHIRRVSPIGSANTCGWFHPTNPNTLIFASTISAPIKQETPGYQRGTRNYRWSFPPEMRVVELDLGAKEITTESLKTIVGDGKAYTAECSTSPDGRTLLYTSLESGDGDLYAMDMASKKITRLTALTGYDGGGFFSPDGKKIVWRADRNADNVLQIFVADVVFGIGEPIAVTNDGAVNWAPYFSPNGKVIVYASSRVGHDNYELLAVPVPADRAAPLGQPRRVTHAGGADLLPAISPDGKLLMWTSQRGPGRSSQLWLANMSQNDLLMGELVAPVTDTSSTPVTTTPSVTTSNNSTNAPAEKPK
jgi:TolB protein